MAEQNPNGTDVSVLESGTAEVRLVGGPEGIPSRLMASVEQIANGKIKVPHLTGYEHYVRVASDDEAVYLFSWTTRTKIAE